VSAAVPAGRKALPHRDLLRFFHGARNESEIQSQNFFFLLQSWESALPKVNFAAESKMTFLRWPSSEACNYIADCSHHQIKLQSSP